MMSQSSFTKTEDGKPPLSKMKKSEMERTVQKSAFTSAGQVNIQLDPKLMAAQQMVDTRDEKQKLIDDFNSADVRGQAKLLKSLATRTEQDVEIDIRQKCGQLRFGDVISLAF